MRQYVAMSYSGLQTARLRVELAGRPLGQEGNQSRYAFVPTADTGNAIRDWPELDNRTILSIYKGDAQNGWYDASYNIQPGPVMAGMIYGNAKCASTQPKVCSAGFVSGRDI